MSLQEYLAKARERVHDRFCPICAEVAIRFQLDQLAAECEPTEEGTT